MYMGVIMIMKMADDLPWSCKRQRVVLAASPGGRANL